MVNIKKIKSIFNRHQSMKNERRIDKGVKAYIDRFGNQEYSPYKMHRIHEGRTYCFTTEWLELYADEKYNEYDAEEIRNGFRHGLSIDDAKLYLKPDCDNHQQRIAAREIIEDCNKGVFDKQQAYQLRLSMEHELPMRYILLYADAMVQSCHMMHMRLGFEYGVSEDRMKYFHSLTSDVKSSARGQEILYGFMHGLTNEQISKFAKYSMFAIRQIRLAYEHGCTEEQVDYLISKIDNDYKHVKLTPVELNKIKGLNPYYVDMLRPSVVEYDDMIVHLRSCLESGFPLETVKMIFDNIHHCANIELIKLAVSCDYPIDDVMRIFRDDKDYNDDQRDVLFHAIANRLPIEHIMLMINWDFDYLQMIEILEGFLAKLSPYQVLVYASTDFDYLKMAEIRTGFLCGLSLDEVKRYADPELTSVEMAMKRAEILDRKKKDDRHPYVK